MTEITTLRLELSGADLAAGVGLMMICGGVALVLRHPAAQEVLRRLAENPEAQKLAEQIGRELLDSVLRAVGASVLPPSVN